MIYGRIYGFFMNPLKQVTKCCKMFTILADSFPSVLDEHERGTLCEELRRYGVWDPPGVPLTYKLRLSMINEYYDLY